MSEKSRLRSGYDALERTVGPRLEAMVRSDEFARATALLARTRGFVGKQVGGVSARLWHMANLPAGSDVQRLRVQIGQLDREVRRLRLQLAAQDEAPAKGVSERGTDPSERT